MLRTCQAFRVTDKNVSENEEMRPMVHGSEIAFTDTIKTVQEKYGVREYNEGVLAWRPWGKGITDELGKFMAQRDSFYLATASSDGRPYISSIGVVRVVS